MAMAAGLAVIFACGLTWLAWLATPSPAGFPQALRLGLYPFVLVDVFKLLVAAAVLPGVWKLVGRGSANGSI
jgi:biotin transporter BioY